MSAEIGSPSVRVTGPNFDVEEETMTTMMTKMIKKKRMRCQRCLKDHNWSQLQLFVIAMGRCHVSNITHYM